MKPTILVMLAAWFFMLSASLPVVAQEFVEEEEFSDIDESMEDGFGDYEDEATIEDEPYPEDAEVETDDGRADETSRDVDIDYFRRELSTSGEWIWTPEHSWVWRPMNMKSEWKPYTYGRWVYTRSGWTWSSYFDWGWAPFHYGRWSHLNPFGWIWVPGTKWAPAWVSWRYSGNHIGWAPILAGNDYMYGWNYYPVHYNHWSFISWHSFYDPHPYHHYISHRRLRNTFHRTYYPRRCRSSWGKYCMRGPSRKMVSRRLGKPIKRMRIKRVGIRSRKPGRHSGRMRVDRDTRRRSRKTMKKSEPSRNRRYPHTRFNGSSKRSRSSREGIHRTPLRGKSINPNKPVINRPSRYYPRTNSGKPTVRPSHTVKQSRPPARSNARPKIRSPKRESKNRPAVAPSRDRSRHSPRVKNSGSNRPARRRRR